jgi:hypothetical protein
LLYVIDVLYTSLWEKHKTMLSAAGRKTIVCKSRAVVTGATGETDKTTAVAMVTPYTCLTVDLFLHLPKYETNKVYYIYT